ncbi:hypothetical protein SK128_006334, partial [Halocaridina rubra]
MGVLNFESRRYRQSVGTNFFFTMTPGQAKAALANKGLGTAKHQDEGKEKGEGQGRDE